MGFVLGLFGRGVDSEWRKLRGRFSELLVQQKKKCLACQCSCFIMSVYASLFLPVFKRKKIKQKKKKKKERSLTEGFGGRHALI